MGIVKLWTKDEDRFLKENYPKYGPKWCGEKLDRSKGGTQRRASKLGVKSNKLKLIYHEDTLRSTILKSKTLSDVLNYLGLRCAGGNYQTIKKYIDLYKIDISHFDSDEVRNERLREYLNTIKKPLGEILIEGSTYNRTNLKKRLVDEEVLEYKCRKCNNDGEWMGEKITLQLEHKNGIHNDNRIENLEFLCPNCHSQTSTYAGKNSNK